MSYDANAALSERRLSERDSGHVIALGSKGNTNGIHPKTKMNSNISHADCDGEMGLEFTFLRVYEYPPLSLRQLEQGGDFDWRP